MQPSKAMSNPEVKNPLKQFEVRQQIIYVEAPFQPPGVYPKYHSKQSIVLAACQICTGILCIIFNIVAIIVGSYWASLGTGFVAGTFFIFSGIIGMLTVRWETKCMINAQMVYSIISACLSLTLFGIGVTAWARDAVDCQGYNSLYHCYQLKQGTRIYASAFMVFLAIIQTVLATWSAVICCQAVCKGPKLLQGNVIQMTPAVVQDGTTGQQSHANYLDNSQHYGQVEIEQ